MAATQGALGSTSTGSMKISIHIPQSIRLVAKEFDQPTIPTGKRLCLDIIDTAARSKENIYRVQAFNSIANKRLLSAEFAQLDNIYARKQHDIPRCLESSNADNATKWQNPNKDKIYLMLIPE